MRTDICGLERGCCFGSSVELFENEEERKDMDTWLAFYSVFDSLPFICLFLEVQSWQKIGMKMEQGYDIIIMNTNADDTYMMNLIVFRKAATVTNFEQQNM